MDQSNLHQLPNNILESGVAPVDQNLLGAEHAQASTVSSNVMEVDMGIPPHKGSMTPRKIPTARKSRKQRAKMVSVVYTGCLGLLFLRAEVLEL